MHIVLNVVRRKWEVKIEAMCSEGHGLTGAAWNIARSEKEPGLYHLVSLVVVALVCWVI